MARRMRDATARTRIREYLVTHGAVLDDGGGATAVLRDAVQYQGSPVAFIQLITAMDEAGEIVRDIRGKRTYGISSPAAAPTSVHPAGAGVAPLRLADVAGPAVDHDVLARALLRELVRSVGGQAEAAGGAGVDVATELEQVRAERDTAREERDEYARRLDSSRRQLNALMALYVDETDESPVAEGKQLLAQLRESHRPAAVSERAS